MESRELWKSMDWTENSGYLRWDGAGRGSSRGTLALFIKFEFFYERTIFVNYIYIHFKLLH